MKLSIAKFSIHGNTRDKTTANDGTGTGQVWLKARQAYAPVLPLP
jgi:hypothetical protein